MAARLLYRRPEPLEEHVRAGLAPSSGVTWAQLAHLANWVRARGSVLVPGVILNYTVAAGTTAVWRFRARPRTAAVEHIVVIWARSAVGAALTVASPSGGTGVEYVVPGDRDISTPIIYTRALAAVSGAEGEITVSVAAAGGDVFVDTITVYEQDRALLAKNAVDHGVDAETEMVRQPIRYTNRESYRGIVQTLGNLDARRTGLLHLARPDLSPWTRTSATLASLTALPIPLLARVISRSSTTGRVKWSAYAKVTADSGSVKLSTSQSGVADTATVTSTSYAWTTPRVIDIDCEDITDDDGLQGGGFDRVTVEGAGNGANTISILSVCVWDDDEEPVVADGLRAWYRADTVTDIAGAVDLLYDRSGNGNHAQAPSSGNRGTVGGSGFNGSDKSYVDTITDDYYRVLAFAWGGAVSAFTFVVIAQRDGGATDGYFVDYTPDAGANRIFMNTGVASVQGSTSGAGSSASNTTSDPGTAGMFWYRWTGAVQSVGAGATQEDSDANTHAAFADGGPLNILSRYVAASVTFDGNTADLLIYNRALSDAELAEIHADAKLRGVVS